MLPGLQSWASAASAFVEDLRQWSDRLAPLELAELVDEAGGPHHIAVFVVDLVNGFCYEGPLQSDRVARIVEPIVDLLVRADRLGVRDFVLVADEHRADALEFSEFPVHCVRHSVESQIVPDLRRLPFATRYTLIRKNSISASIGTTLDRWLASRREVTHRVVLGAGTDLGVYQTAMHLKLTSNARNIDLPVVVPADCVDTYDLPSDVAHDFGIPAHPGDALHCLFLHHMHLNGVRVVSHLE